ncbi:MAG: anti-sigma factor antagonist [Oscillospiraceae bacterium]
MITEIEINEEKITALLIGEIDHHNAPSIREKIDECIERQNPRVLTMDFSGVTFMDSSGIGLVMGRYKLLAAREGKLEIIGLSNHAYKVMRLAGLEKIATLKRECKEVITK